MATQARRIELHEELCKVLGSRNVYFSPPESIKLKFPCIVYHLSVGRSFNANNKPYMITDSYDVQVIDADPDSQIPDKLMNGFDMIRKDRVFTQDNLLHSSFVLYY